MRRTRALASGRWTTDRPPLDPGSRLQSRLVAVVFYGVYVIGTKIRHIQTGERTREGRLRTTGTRRTGPSAASCRLLVEPLLGLRSAAPNERCVAAGSLDSTGSAYKRTYSYSMRTCVHTHTTDTYLEGKDGGMDRDASTTALSEQQRRWQGTWQLLTMCIYTYITAIGN
ncbi:hypothetical protein GGS23DRAFT_262291 [Durotheca rogersii]|uniref:uncharacterized protein n=1 Tax=Durotheca rogersii TaxID=419775 RepID=UPI00221FD06D|nr:uncharacterized protein GGS23DRAFT_262291 [Durotheca rogersii]KAI5859813.1 hypothetical protein GGS23DRAFT_262291 [Durotheca rogersii]